MRSSSGLNYLGPTVPITMRALPLLASFVLPTVLFAQVVINEVDYDQPGTDGAEFIEIKNVGTSAFPLQYLAVVLVNGAGGTSQTYLTISSPSWPALEPGGYFVICGNTAATPDCDHLATPATNLIQNGVPDAIALVNTQSDEVLDAVSYGGSILGYTEGTGTTAVDANSMDDRSLNRWPDGADSNDNNADFRVGCSTPGATNFVDPVQCDIPSAVAEVAVPTTFSVILDAANDQMVLNWGGDASSSVTFEVFNIAGSKVAERNAGSGRLVSWSLPLMDLHGQLLLVRATSGGRQQVRRVVVP